ncbi:oxidoreductase [Frankia gtarii]|uniref:oxidoreductase n=1 Tax=Frankia gtarii TaxID=2950102 RepID=UPI0021C02D49|nr:oxidoreductase [Frankia gtarii]
MKVRSTDIARWTVADVPDQRGRTVVVTGANSGIGFETARMLAEHGATVVLACRDVARARRAAARIRAGIPTPYRRAERAVRVEQLDLASIASVRSAAERIRAAHPRLDLLINNAGVMRPPPGHTEDGFEPTFGINHLGHFALTGLLLDRLLATAGSRIVTVSSLLHRYGRIDVEHLHSRPSGERRSRRPYPDSKLANVMFTLELQRRLAQAGAPTIAVAAHPGIARTELARHLPPPVRMFMGARMAPVMSWLIQSPQVGALAPVRAAVDPDARGGGYYGPDGLFHSSGPPVVTAFSAHACDLGRRRRLWGESERLTGVTYDLREPPRSPPGVRSPASSTFVSP